MPPLTDTRGVEGRQTGLVPVELPAIDLGRSLWLLLLFATLADVVTTLYGISIGLTEGNPFVATTLATTGVPGFLVLKAAVLGFGFACWRLLPRRHAIAVPAGLAVPTLLAAASNTVALAPL